MVGQESLQTWCKSFWKAAKLSQVSWKTHLLVLRQSPCVWGKEDHDTGHWRWLEHDPAPTQFRSFFWTTIPQSVATLHNSFWQKAKAWKHRRTFRSVTLWSGAWSAFWIKHKLSFTDVPMRIEWLSSYQENSAGGRGGYWISSSYSKSSHIFDCSVACCERHTTNS